MSMLSKAEFDYIETKDISRASKIDLNCTGIYVEASIIYFEIKNIAYFLIVYPGREEVLSEAVKGAMKIAYALTETYKKDFEYIPGIEFAMGMDQGHIMGTKTLSDNGMEHLSWFGTCIYKAIRISKECSRPFHIGISGAIYHNLSDDLRVSYRRVLGIKKSVEVWTKVTYQYENVKKHLYQTNHKIPIDDEA